MRKKTWFSIIIVICLVWPSIQTPLHAQSFKEQFVDSTDNAFDISTWLSQVYGFVPLVTLITEPTTGYGAAGGLIFVHKRKEDLEKPAPPSISMIGGLYTQNKTWGGLLLHQGIWKEDRIRYLGILGYVSANLTLYQDAPDGEELSFNFNLSGGFLTQEMVFRIGNTNVFLGGRYNFFTSESSFDTEGILPVDSTELSLNTGSLGPVLAYDSRDNTFTPNSGMFFKATQGFYQKIFGSDREFQKIDSYWTGYMNPTSWLVLGLRADFRWCSAVTPFYSKPFVMLRGIPLMRYQGNRVLVLETEERFDITRRWSLVGFAGVGNAHTDTPVYSSNHWAWSVGSGIRYKIARQFNLYTGVDVARGNEIWAFYIQFGHYWNGL